MDAINDKAFAALGAYPIIQSAVALLTLLGALYLGIRATRDRPPPSPPHEPVPQWLLIAPMHDLIEDAADIADHMRQQTKLLEKIDASLMACKVSLELIRDESRLR
ncbi:MAG: hypothetical protein WBA48_03550 [Xanthobacteraceae bacterium]